MNTFDKADPGRDAGDMEVKVTSCLAAGDIEDWGEESGNLAW